MTNQKQLLTNLHLEDHEATAMIKAQFMQLWDGEYSSSQSEEHSRTRQTVEAN